MENARNFAIIRSNLELSKCQKAFTFVIGHCDICAECVCASAYFKAHMTGKLVEKPK